MDIRPAVTVDQSGNSFRLDATGLVTAQASVTYQWTLVSRPSGSTATLTAAASPIAALTADANGNYAVELSLTEGGVTRAPISMTFSRATIEPVAAIKAVAGVNTVAVNKTVSLTAAPSYDPNGGWLTYQWTVVSKPAGSNAALTSNGSVLSAFTPDVAGIYEVTMTVTNTAGLIATDKMQLVTGAGLAQANAGPDISTQVGASVFVDPFRSIQTAGKELIANWKIVSAPVSSTATLTNGATLTPHQTGRQRFIPDVAGLYLLSLKVDGGTSSSTDTILIAAGSNATATPVANAGSDQFITAGAVATLDSIGSTDTDGGILSYRWSILLAPIGSTTSVINPNLPIGSLHTDIAGNYVVQLAVSDGNSTSFDTVFISTTLQPISANAGADQILPSSRTVSLSGNASILPQNTTGLLTNWSVLGLGAAGAVEQSQLSSPSQLATNAAFNIVPASTPNPAKALGDYELIVFQNDNSNSQVYGRTFIGGNLTGQSSDYGNGMAGTASGKVILTVGGLINGRPKNINNGGKVRAGASPTATLNFNGGGSLAVDPTVSIASIQNDLTNFSQTLKAMPSTATIAIPTSQPAGVTLNAVPNASGIAVFSVPQGDTLFNNSKVQSINLNLNGATAVVVNVGGANVKIQQANFAGNLNTDSIRSKVIWNFYDAANINITRAVSGSILAPSAQILNSAQINGSVVTRNINQSAAIITPGFMAAAAFATQPAPVQAAVVQLALDNGTNSSYDTILGCGLNCTSTLGQIDTALI